MKKILLLALILAAAAPQPGRAANYKLSASGPFLVIAQDGGFSGNSVSVRKSAVLSAQLEGRRITLLTTGIDVVIEELADGRKRPYARSISYAFDVSSDSDAKELYELLLRELAT